MWWDDDEEPDLLELTTYTCNKFNTTKEYYSDPETWDWSRAYLKFTTTWGKTQTKWACVACFDLGWNQFMTKGVTGFAYCSDSEPTDIGE